MGALSAGTIYQVTLEGPENCAFHMLIGFYQRPSVLNAWLSDGFALVTE